MPRLSRSPLFTPAASATGALVLSLLIPGWPAALRAEGQAPPQVSVPGQAASSRPCRIQGHLTSGDLPLPGATVTAKAGDKVVLITSSDLDGAYSVAVAPGSYTLRVELTAFATLDKEVTAGQPPCAVTLDLKTQLASRTPGYVAPKPAPPVAATTPAAGRTGRGRDFKASAGRVAAVAAPAGLPVSRR
jgi:Carboxypeptidase regulatory-like domain